MSIASRRGFVPQGPPRSFFFRNTRASGFVHKVGNE
jgi:hypothetical protein